ncbi:MAG: L-serine ammonia-lyase, iron-sulfur-dependent, subunit alpha [Clostridia bacterium]|nr:L-serine ammonia-lyase, iron-sulfur-dependent, subunit alpha [Clostridia bacterium]
MQSLKDLYKTGKGPSSSHTIGPQVICEYALKKYGQGRYRVDLFGSLSLTGKGHGTDRVIKSVLGEETEINFAGEASGDMHPNTLDVYRLEDGGAKKLFRAESVGGGAVKVDGKDLSERASVYPEKNFSEIKRFCLDKGFRLSDYARYYEKDIDGYMLSIWQAMKNCVERGLNKDGVLEGGLKLERKARSLINERSKNETSLMRENRKISAYSFAVAEENADNGEVVTAPTCGSAGVLPACLYYIYKEYNVSEKEIINALLSAGVVGNVVKANASISGAECGCQAEVGVACSMAAAAIADVYDLDINKIECAAEIALEHNLGLTCDPVLGLVQIPCIERNATAAIKAFNAATLSKTLSEKCKITFDEIVEVMYKTGKDMAEIYRETAQGGLAEIYKENILL